MGYHNKVYVSMDADNDLLYYYSPEEYELDCQMFEEKYKEYQENHLPEKKVITEKVETLLNEMRKDLGNEEIIH